MTSGQTRSSCLEAKPCQGEDLRSWGGKHSRQKSPGEELTAIPCGFSEPGKAPGSVWVGFGATWDRLECGGVGLKIPKNPNYSVIPQCHSGNLLVFGLVFPPGNILCSSTLHSAGMGALNLGNLILSSSGNFPLPPDECLQMNFPHQEKVGNFHLE